ncbi:VCBS repeat-containing protein [Flagellimonas sp.]|uniref:VCBS repeat-containing protein n=1 Tax=Flagellimonas sp. TaxID=2058762 RepID=UPI003B51A958
MYKRSIKYLFSLLIGFGFEGCDQQGNTLFLEHNEKNTGITFNNQLEIGGEINVLDFEYMYNGAGVAVADFDNDGLVDIYFTGNMVRDRLYKNLGEWKFGDITESANVGISGWSNGIAVTDINQDGLPDIYVCRGGDRKSTPKEMSNLLYINNGVQNGKLTFTEQAKQWGLADPSYSTQANFFDYDLDGDLDMYLLNNALVDYNRNTPRPKELSGNAPSTDKLFRNNGDQTFTDVSLEANIQIEGFGLGVEICDMNADGWPDVYVSNDFLTDDILYINQGNGTFKNEIAKYLKHLTFNGMGNDIADINNDGLMDVVVLDMLPPDNQRWKLTMTGNNYDSFNTRVSGGYQHQYIRNTLQLNNGNGSFSEVGQFSGISATEWSWSPLFADYDQNGTKDLFITNGYRQDITNLDFMVYGNTINSMGTEEANKKERLEALNKLPGIKLNNFMFSNRNGLQFEDITKEAGFSKPTYSNGAAYADLDNDGDLDLIVNNIDDPAGVYENTTQQDGNHNYISFRFKGESPNLEGIGSQVEVFYQGQLQKQFFTPFRGYLSTMENTVHFGLGKVTTLDSVKITWPNGLQQVLKNVDVNQRIVLHQKEAETVNIRKAHINKTWFKKVDSIGLEFTHVENEFVDYKIQPLLPHMHSKNGPGMAVSDVNGDGLEDIYIGGASGQSGSLRIQQPDLSFSAVPFPDAAQEDMGMLFFDADADGDQDLYVSSGGSSNKPHHLHYEDRLYENDGLGNFSRVNALPNNLSSSSMVTAADYDKDGDLDLFIGGRVRPGEYPLAPSSFILNNKSVPGKILFEEDSQFETVIKELGMVTSALWTDINNDSWPDLIVVGEFMPIKIFQNNQGILEEISEESGLTNSGGWWNSITSGDFDNDGDSDYVLGNLGLNSRFKATDTEPLCVYASDYDKNGQVDPVLCHFVDGERQIAHSRSDLIDQINAMRGRFRNYSDYANATFSESFTKEEIANALVLKSETFASSYMENLGGGKFKLTPLPSIAQIAPMYGTLVGDYNQDNKLDILAVGNFYNGEVFGGRYDASIGWFLAGDGTGNFSPQDVRETGFFVPGDAKSLTNLFLGDTEVVVASINNGNNITYTMSRKDLQIYRAKPEDVAAIIQYPSGEIQKVELHYGSSYLSQKSRSLILPKDAESVRILNSNGNESEIQLVP